MTDFEFQIDNFMLYCTSRNLSKKTLGSYEQTLKLLGVYLQTQFQIIDVKKVQSGHIRNYIKYIQERGKYSVVSSKESIKVNFPENRKDYNKPVSTVTVANYVRNIKVFFNWLYSIENEITKNPCEKIENPKIIRKIKKKLSVDSLKLVLRQFDTSRFHDYRNSVITKTLLDTGMRISECLSIEASHIDFKNKSILITNPKNKQQRYVYFSPKLSLILKHWLKYHDRYSDCIFVFPTTRGTKLDIRNYEKALREAGKRVQIDIHPHQLRNNFAKYYILNGGDWFTLSRILGHSSVEVTQKAYLDFSDEEVGRKFQMHSPLSHMDI